VREPQRLRVGRVAFQGALEVRLRGGTVARGHGQ
jgi:hypothetical protein